MSVIGYQYDADYHCESCMLKYARDVPYSEYVFGEYSDDDISHNGIIDLMKAVEFEIIRDGENNPIHSVFSTSEWWEPSDESHQVLICSNCGNELDEVNTP